MEWDGRDRVPGVKGRQRSKWDQGPPESKGDKGPPGSKGDQGIRGLNEDGRDGHDGMQGIKGDWTFPRHLIKYPTTTYFISFTTMVSVEMH